VDIDVAGRIVSITSPDKVMFPQQGQTKLDVVGYYRSVEHELMAAIRGRPVLMQRFPNGVDGSSFFQKRVPKDAPDWLETSVVSTPNGTTSRALVAADLAHIVWAVNLGCLGFHVWPNLAADDEHADELRIDLDPQPGVTFDDVRAAAGALHTLLDELGIRGWPKTTGQPRIHVYTLEPRWSPVEVRRARRVACGVGRSAARRDHRRGGREERGDRASSTSTRTHRTRRCSARGRIRPARVRQVSTPFAGTSSTTSTPMCALWRRFRGGSRRGGTRGPTSRTRRRC
jgi:DNA ligase D-like protein (predicted polymerase)